MHKLSDAQMAVYRESFRQRLQQRYQEREALRAQALAAVKVATPLLAGGIQSLQKVYLFGSVTHPGHFQEDSDIDIAVVGTTAADYFAFWRELDQALPRWTIDMREVSNDSHFAQRIRKTGILLFARIHSPAAG